MVASKAPRPGKDKYADYRPPVPPPRHPSPTPDSIKETNSLYVQGVEKIQQEAIDTCEIFHNFYHADPAKWEQFLKTHLDNMERALQPIEERAEALRHDAALAGAIPEDIEIVDHQHLTSPVHARRLYAKTAKWAYMRCHQPARFQLFSNIDQTQEFICGHEDCKDTGDFRHASALQIHEDLHHPKQATCGLYLGLVFDSRGDLVKHYMDAHFEKDAPPVSIVSKEWTHGRLLDKLEK